MPSERQRDGLRVPAGLFRAVALRCKTLDGLSVWAQQRACKSHGLPVARTHSKMPPMAKWKMGRQERSKLSEGAAPADHAIAITGGTYAVSQPEPHRLPAGRWMQVKRVRENGVSGWVLDELLQDADGSFSRKRIHGPDLFDITTYRHENEVVD